MSSTILYKFRSGTTFEALPLPGSAARLFDVKKAIVTAKKLDAGSMDFDLSVRNATTNEEYTDESMLLPRGTRLVVQRLPAAKGHGFLARMARNQYGGAPGPAGAAGGAGGGGSGLPSGFYEIDSRAHDEDDEEFVTSGGAGGGGDDEEDELAALKAVTDISTATSVGVRPAAASFGRGGGGPAGQGPPQHQSGGHGGQQRLPKQRANADPELRDQEKKSQPRRKATGIPRTFLSLSVAPTAEAQDGDGDGESNTPILQPNTMGFEQLKSRGGGQSESASGTKKDLEYALKVTATTIPDYLQCALCNSVALTAMFLTWDPEGRTTCDKCIRDALAQNGFRDPLTGMEGISPDDLRPNPGIRKAAEAFVKEVMDKIEEIEREQVDEEPTSNQAVSRGGNLLDADSGEKGIIVTKRNSITKRKIEEDPFGGEDDFGGDVFAVVAEEKPEEEEDAGAPETPAKESNDKAGTEKSPNAAAETAPAANPAANDNGGDTERTNPHTKESGKFNSPEVDRQNKNNDSSSPPDHKGEESQAPNRANSDRYQKRDNRQQNNRQRRGPPVGYQMGPAGGATHGAIQAERPESDDYQQQSYGGRGRGRAFSPRGGGRYNDQGRGGRGGRGRGRGRFDRYQPQQQQQQQQPQQSGKADWDGHSASRDRRSPSRDDVSFCWQCCLLVSLFVLIRLVPLSITWLGCNIPPWRARTFKSKALIALQSCSTYLLVL